MKSNAVSGITVCDGKREVERMLDQKISDEHTNEEEQHPDKGFLVWIVIVLIVIARLLLQRITGSLEGTEFYITAGITGVILALITSLGVIYGWNTLFKKTGSIVLKILLVLVLLIAGTAGVFALFSPEAEPFAVMVCGNDQEGEVSEYGRTDVNIVAVVNPETAQIALISLPRDLFIPNPGLNYEYDKLTHLGNHGIENTKYGVSWWLNEDIDYCALVNFTAFTELIDAIGGITIDNPYEFTYSWEPAVTFAEGKIHLNGEEALLYVRERYNLVNGDFDRNEHQQIVLKAVIRKIFSIKGILSLPSLLSTARNAVITDMSTVDLLMAAGRLLLHIKDLNLYSASVEGYTSYEYCASIPDTPVSVVWPDEDSAWYAAEVLETVENGGIPGK